MKMFLFCLDVSMFVFVYIMLAKYLIDQCTSAADYHFESTRFNMAATSSDIRKHKKWLQLGVVVVETLTYLEYKLIASVFNFNLPLTCN